MVREQATSDVFWKDQINYFVLVFASSESSEGHMKPTSKDEEYTH